MAGIASLGVVQYLAANGSATQKQLAADLDLSQASVSRVLRETPGITKDDSVSPAIYSFDPTGIVAPVTKPNRSNDTGVIRPDGSIFLSGVVYSPMPDTLSDEPLSNFDAYFVKVVEQLNTYGGLAKQTKKNNIALAETLEKIAYTIRARAEKGDFDA